MLRIIVNGKMLKSMNEIIINAVTLMLRQSCYEHEHIINAVVALMYAREILSKGRLKIRM